MKIFISHSSKDKKFVRHLKDCLLENTIETWVDENQLDFGDILVNKLENALEETSHLVIILSPTSIETDWVNFELKKALENPLLVRAETTRKASSSFKLVPAIRQDKIKLQP